MSRFIDAKTLTFALIAFFVAGLGLAAASQEQELVGKWKVVRWIKKDKEGAPPADVVVTMAFRADHQWIGEVTAKGKTMPQERGRWELKGNQLVTTSKRGSDAMTISLKGNTLELSKAGASDKLVLQRIQ